MTRDEALRLKPGDAVLYDSASYGVVEAAVRRIGRCNDGGYENGCGRCVLVYLEAPGDLHLLASPEYVSVGLAAEGEGNT